MKRITIADVAKRAGVSISTVSYALSNKRPIEEMTKQKIYQAIRDLGYRPNQSARRLASKEKTRNIGFVLPLQGTELTGLEIKFISGAAKAINEADYTFILLAHPDRNPENLERFARNGVVDGFILMEVFMKDERVELLKKMDLPFVLVGRCQDNDGLVLVDLDIEKSMQEFFSYFISKGHDRISFLYKEDDNLGLAVRTIQQYRASCQHHHIEPAMLTCQLSSDDGERAMNELLDQRPDLNAVIVWNEIPAIGAARAIKARGIRIPDDFIIICLVQSQVSNSGDFAPVVIDIRAEEVAAKAAELMIAMLENQPIEQPQILIPPKLIPPGGL